MVEHGDDPAAAATTLPPSLSLCPLPSVLTATFQGGPGLADTECLHSGLDVGGGDNWHYKMCKAPVKSSPPTNQHPAFYRLDVLSVAQPTVTKH